MKCLKLFYGETIFRMGITLADVDSFQIFQNKMLKVSLLMPLANQEPQETLIVQVRSILQGLQVYK